MSFKVTFSGLEEFIRNNVADSYEDDTQSNVLDAAIHYTAQGDFVRECFAAYDAARDVERSALDVYAGGPSGDLSDAVEELRENLISAADQKLHTEIQKVEG